MSTAHAGVALAGAARRLRCRCRAARPRRRLAARLPRSGHRARPRRSPRRWPLSATATAAGTRSSGSTPRPANEYLPALPALDPRAARLPRPLRRARALAADPSLRAPARDLLLLDSTGSGSTARAAFAALVIVAGAARGAAHLRAPAAGSSSSRWARPGRRGDAVAFSPAAMIYGVASADALFATLGLAAACLLVGRGCGRRSPAARSRWPSHRSSPGRCSRSAPSPARRRLLRERARLGVRRGARRRSGWSWSSTPCSTPLTGYRPARRRPRRRTRPTASASPTPARTRSGCSARRSPSLALAAARRLVRGARARARAIRSPSALAVIVARRRRCSASPRRRRSGSGSSSARSPASPRPRSCPRERMPLRARPARRPGAADRAAHGDGLVSAPSSSPAAPASSAPTSSTRCSPTASACGSSTTSTRSPIPRASRPRTCRPRPS